MTKKNNAGFTLLELFVAATIIGILAVFSTVAYKNGAASTRAAGARAKVDALAWAQQRYLLDPAACPSYVSTTNKITALEDCKLLERKVILNDEYFTFAVCPDEVCSKAPDMTSDMNPLACVVGKDNKKMPAKYAKNYWYCVSETAHTEHLGN